MMMIIIIIIDVINIIIIIIIMTGSLKFVEYFSIEMVMPMTMTVFKVFQKLSLPGLV